MATFAPTIARPRRNVLRPAALLLATAALSAAVLQTACGAERAAPVETSRRDSVGVEIVESAAPAWTPGTAPRFASEPRVQIGTLDGPEALQLFEVRFSTVLSDGRIVIANGGTSELRFFGRDGTFERAVGGEGQGPGEFEFLSSLYSRLPGDTLRLFDGATRRITEFDGTGALVRSVRVDPPGGGDLGAIFGGTFTDGRMVVSTVSLPSIGEMSDGDMIRGERTYWAIDGEGEAQEITHLLEPERQVRIGDGSVGIVTAPFRFSEQAAPHDDLAVSATDRHEVRWYAPEGPLRRVARWSGATRELTPERYEEWLAGLDLPEDRVAGLRRQHEGLPMPQSLPTATRLLIDPDGNAWLEEYRLTPSEPAMWTVIAADGTWLGEVEMPSGLRPHEIGRDYVIGLWQVELDVQYVRLYDLTRGG